MTRDEIFDVFKDNLFKIVDAARGKEVAEVLSMRDLGADSLEMVEVASRTMKQLRVRIPRTELSKARNIGELLDLLEQNLSATTS